MRSVLLFPFRVPFLLLKWMFAGRYRFVFLLILVFGGMVFGTVEGWHYASSPDFCRSCHHMEPYWQSWSRSTHKHVQCIGCHFEPGLGNEFHAKFQALKQLASAVTGMYSSRPFAEVSDRSCLRSGCHSTRGLGKEVEFSKRGVFFDHPKHLGELPFGIKLACISCHSQVTVDNHMEVDRNTCFLCHFKGSKAPDGTPDPMEACGVCHGAPRKELSVGGLKIDHKDFLKRGMECAQCHLEVVSGTGEVGRGRCLGCHNQPSYLEEFGDVEALHLKHVSIHKLNCYLCHERIEHRFRTEEGTVAESHPKGLPDGDCSKCHLEPHSPQAAFYAGKGAVSVQGEPDPMSKYGLDCSACHGLARRSKAEINAHSRVDSATLARGSCNGCHGQGYSEFVGPFLERVGEVQHHLEKRLDRVLETFRGIEEREDVVPRKTFHTAKNTEKDLAFLRRARPIHNPFFAVAILRRADRDLAVVEKDLGVPVLPGRPKDFPKEGCLVCHEALPPPGKIKLKDGKVFSHRMAFKADGPTCTACHKGPNHPAKPVVPYGVCSTCHKK